MMLSFCFCMNRIRESMVIMGLPFRFFLMVKKTKVMSESKRVRVHCLGMGAEVWCWEKALVLTEHKPSVFLLDSLNVI